MFCSGSESSQVEHYRPKAMYPEQTFDWGNLLWACGICNQAKGSQFDERRRIYEPMAEDPWQLFFLDEFGNLRARIDPSTGDYFVRAVATMKTLALDREPLQHARQHRYRSLCKTAKELVDLHAVGQRTVLELQERVQELKDEPSQPDVADYFLDGPGRVEAPFKRLMEIVELEPASPATRRRYKPTRSEGQAELRL
jgi:uncharacterized protein (TIGR02646 family)